MLIGTIAIKKAIATELVITALPQVIPIIKVKLVSKGAIKVSTLATVNIDAGYECRLL